MLVSLAVARRIDTAFIPTAVLALACCCMRSLSRGLLLHLEFLLRLLLVEVLIMVVPLEILFEFFLVQQLHVCLNLLVILILPVRICVIRIEVVLVWRNEGRWVLPLLQVVPREVDKPRMVLDVLWTIQAQSI